MSLHWISPNGLHRAYHGDAMDILPSIGQCESLVTDPPYVGPCESGHGPPAGWYELARDRVERSYVMCSTATLPQCLATVGSDYHDTLVASPSNGLVVGPSGISSWLPIVVAWPRHKIAVDANSLSFAVTPEDAANHLGAKPVGLFLELLRLRRIRSVLDPFMGSGAIGAACVRAGIPYVGVEIDRRHFALAVERLAATRR